MAARCGPCTPGAASRARRPVTAVISQDVTVTHNEPVTAGPAPFCSHPSACVSLPMLAWSLSDHVRDTTTETDQVVVCLDLETGPDTDSPVFLVAASVHHPRPWGPQVATVRYPSELEVLAPLLGDDRVRTVIHHVPFDARFLLRAGVVPRRVWDTCAVERLLLRAENRSGSASLAGCWARATGLGDLPPYLHTSHLRTMTPAERARLTSQDPHPDCMEPVRPDGHLNKNLRSKFLTPGFTIEQVTSQEVAYAAMDIIATQVTYDDQLRRLDKLQPGLPLLCEAVSDSGLSATLLSHTGLPWDHTTSTRILDEVLGPEPAPGQPYLRLREAEEAVYAAFNGAKFPIRSDQARKEALLAAGISVEATTLDALDKVDHPGASVMAAYLRLANFANDFDHAWVDTRFRDGRLHLDFTPEGTKTGRWSSSGRGLGLSPRLHPAIRPGEGRCLVVADFHHLEPRILAQLSRDRKLHERLGDGTDDLYATLATNLGCTRAHAKTEFVASMYGLRSPKAQELSALFPVAAAWLNQQELRGSRHHDVWSVLGRRCPDQPDVLKDLRERRRTGRLPDEEYKQLLRLSAKHGRTCRNFPIQASASDLALVTLMLIRQRLPRGTNLVYYLHDEFVVETPDADAGRVAGLIDDAAADAADAIFGTDRVPFPLRTQIVEHYGQAKT